MGHACVACRFLDCRITACNNGDRNMACLLLGHPLYSNLLHAETWYEVFQLDPEYKNRQFVNFKPLQLSQRFFYVPQNIC